MKVIAGLMLLAASAQGFVHDRAHYELHFEEWRQEHGREYKPAEYVKRLEVFAANVDKIEQHNAAGHPWTMEVNKFADLTGSEFEQQMGLGVQKYNATSTGPFKSFATAEDAPASVDWRTKGAVTPVKNQGQCGSCWAFSSTGSIEGARFLATGKLTSMSEQQLVDCAGQYGNMGCNGGIMDNAFEYIVANGGLDTEASYPYTAVTGTTCKAKSGDEIKNVISGHTDVTPKSESDMMKAVAQQPVSIAIEADKQCFQFYSGGVLTGASCACGTQLDHGVLTVGYGTDSGTDYWIVKNSWGTTWGEEGYIKLERGYTSAFNKAGMCGMLTLPTYPTVSSDHTLARYAEM
jgi:C1A family cysteine protease